MTTPFKDTLNVLVFAPNLGRELSPIATVDACVRILDGNAAFRTVVGRQEDQSSPAEAASAREEVNALLAQADVLCMGFPPLRHIVNRAPRLRWVHHTQAGVSNMWVTDIWGAPQVLLTSGRGYVRPTAMAEYVIAGALFFARGLYDAYLDKRALHLDRSHYEMKRVERATMGVVGLGGIGKEVARLARGLGMRVVATRRSVTALQRDVDYANVLLPAGALNELAAQSDFLAVCTQLTQETTHLINRLVLEAIKPSAVVINVSRGEVIDEDALLQALKIGRVRGAVLDVYEGELDARPPRPQLLELPQVVLTPHISAGGAGSDTGESMRLFCENLRRFIQGEPLLNLVDRTRGY